MPISAKFEADFSQFNDAVGKASDNLDQFGIQTVKLGEQTSAATTGMRSSFSQFDSILASMGIHIGNEVKAIDEMSNAAGKTAGSLGMMATAGLAVGTAMAAWNLTRYVMEFFDLDKYVAQAATSLLGFASAADAVKGANQDVLDKASGIAKRTVTDINEARAIIQKWADDQTLWFERSGNAAAESAAKVAGWHAEIARVKSAGNLPALKADIDSHNESLEVLVKRYGASGDAIKLFTKETAAAAAAQKESHDRMVAESAAHDDMLMARATSTQEALIAINKRGNNKITRMANDKSKLILDATVAEEQAQIRLNAAMGRDASGAIKVQETALDALNAAMTKLHAAKVDNISQTAQEAEITKTFTDRLYEEAAAQDAAYEAQLKSNDAANEAITIKQKAATVITGQGIPAVGNTVGPGGRLMAADYGGAFGVPASLGSGFFSGNNIGAPSQRGSISITNSLSGMLLTTDPQARQQLMDAINASVMASLRTSGAMR